MTPFATVDDVALSWANKRFSDSERVAAKELIERASALIATKMERKGVEIDEDDELQAINLKAVTVALVRRSIAGGESDGLQGVSQTIGSTTASLQFHNNYGGSLSLLPSEEELLGIKSTGGRAGWANI